MQELTQLTNKRICSNTKSINLKDGAHFKKGWVGPQHFGQWAKASLREIAHCPKCNKAAVGSR